ncbi:hypothetical protein CUT44_27770 [Streptomyces carminius]|uniref:Inositolphosphotransferase Aur1/Ipt1 domain-containing protein n=1 Tax=Streptomyces carminius TaxID=2665496 RepID=A0A2M8LQ65_9ACTN|nr:phosphatase PAP2 family protein [Streptomyces carminius]PJE94104.1 hypothetical protein CUT44_27770 [Streptomyces carminius]
MSRNRLLWWTELPLLAAVYAAYSAGRLLARGDVSTAVGNGLAILRFEEWLWLDVERPLNRLFTDNAWLGIPADFFYAALHYLVTPALLVWVYRRRSAHYRRMRTWLLVSTLIGLVGFTLLPTCPPRLLAAGHGFVDTMAQYGHYGWWGGEASAPRGLGGLTNQYAAMPSLHVGWSLWCGVVLWQLAGRRGWVRAVAVGYPLLTTVVVMGTANHYLLDAVAGAAVMGLGLLLTRPATRFAERLAGRLRRYVPTGPAGGAVAVPEGPANAPVPVGAAVSRSGSRSVPRSMPRPSGGPSRRTAGAAPAFGGLNSPVVTTGCHTSPGERHPRQPTDDSPAPAAR